MTSSETSHFITVALVLSLVILIKFFLRRDLWKYVKKLKEDDDWDANIHEVITWIDNLTAKSLARYSWQVDIWVFHKFRYFRLIFLANKNFEMDIRATKQQKVNPFLIFIPKQSIILGQLEWTSNAEIYHLPRLLLSLQLLMVCLNLSEFFIFIFY